MPPLPLPPVLRSRQALREAGVDLLPAGAMAPADLPIRSDGTTYVMAQEAEWLDASHFAVGRWDGSLSVFAWTDSTVSGPLITTAASDPSSEGVQMIQSLGASAFVTSAGDAQLALWTTPDGWESIQPTLVDYDAALGAANSAALMLSGGADWYGLLAVGHANGFLTIWRIGSSQVEPPVLVTTLDLRNPRPVNPWGLHNIRGVAILGTGPFVVTGSEDGFISVVDIVDATIISQTVFNPAAQRGINSIALQGDDLLVANCSVGAADDNLWYFTIASDFRLSLAAKANLKVNPNAQQVFNFCTTFTPEWAPGRFFCSTEEGALWMGTATSGKLSVSGYQEVTSPLGSALAWQPDDRLVLVSYDIYEFLANS